MKKIMLFLCAVMANTAALFSTIQYPVLTDAGPISGTTGLTSDVRVYRGMPYAAPPVGLLRR